MAQEPDRPIRPLGDRAQNVYQEDAEAVRNTLVDEDGNNIKEYNPLPVTDINNTHSAFGELIVGELTPTVQMTAVYGLFPKARILEINGATAGATDNLFFAASGTNSSSAGAIFSIRQLHYRAGQGMLMRATALFDTPVLGNRQRVGMSTAADGYYFSYIEDERFVITRQFDGHVIIQKLTIDTSANGIQDATITIDGTSYIVPLTAGTVAHTANEIANSLRAQILDWAFSQSNGFVICRSLRGQPAVGAFTFTSDGNALATFSEIAPGVTASTEEIAQADWNIDKMDGTGISGMTLDPQKGNVYQISMQYLGFGNIRFYIENPETGSFQEVHQIKYANNNITPSISNPSLRIIWSSENSTSTTDVTIKGASCAGFIEGMIGHTESGWARNNTKSVGNTIPQSILTFRNRTTFGTNVNLSEVIPQLVTVFADTTKGAIITMIKGSVSDPIVLGGEPDFQYIDEFDSIMEFDTAGTTVTGGKLVHSFIAGQDGRVDLTAFDELLLSGETLSIVAVVISGAASEITATLNWDEEL